MDSDSDGSHQAILPSLPLGTNARRPIILNDLPELIRIRIVCELEHISFLDVLSFAQSTKALRKVALSKIYRSIRLMPCLENKKGSTTYHALIDIFRNDAQCEIARHVHSIAIHDGVPAEDVILLLERTAGHGTLGKFSWNTSAHMPDILFDKLHAVRPILQLSVAILDRRISKEAPHYKLDMRLFTSPLLTDLTYAVHSDSTESENPKRPRLPSSTTPSGPKSLRSPKEMIDSARLETTTTTNYKDFASINPDNESRSAVLDELNRQCKHKENRFAYQLRSRNGRVLHESINCTNICALDFGEVNPETFFTVLKGEIPGLKTLRFGTCGGSRARAPAVDFIQSVVALEGLHFTHLCSIDEFGPAIVKHKDSLQTLDLGSRFHAWHCIASISRDSTPLFHGEEVIMRLTRSRKGRARRIP